MITFIKMKFQNFCLTFICFIVSIQGLRLPDGLTIDTCTTRSGECLKSNDVCNGYVDENAMGCDKRRICCKPAPATLHPEPIHPETDQCGLMTRIPSRVRRVVGGDSSQDGEWPWQVSFYDEQGHFCGGTLISDQWIISAAHCFQTKIMSEVGVILGEHHQVYESNNEVRGTVEKWIMHPEYANVHGQPHDIALVKLAKSVDITGHYVRTACLPHPSDIFDETDYCYISGWGYTRGTGDNISLRHLQVQVTNHSACNNSWDGVITDRQICIGDGEIGACQGDSGGPLVCVRDGNYVLAGATSWGSFSCTQYGFPNVYTKISSYLQWISEGVK